MILIRRPWTRQPQGAVPINRAHPLARYVVGHWVSPRYETLLRADGSQIIVASGTSQQIKPHGQGTTFGSYSGTGIISLPNTSEHRLTAVDGSLVAGITLGALTTAQYPTIWAVRDLSTTAALFLIGLDTASYSGGRVALNLAGVELTGTSGSARQHEYAAYGVQWGVSGRRLYVNGELDSTSPNTSQISSTTIQPSLGNRQGGGRALSDGVMHWFFAFNTNIGDVWHRSIAQDPYQMLEQRRILVPVTATSLPTLTALTASNITTSGWRATLTAA